MNQNLQYPFDPELLLRKRKSLKRELLNTPGLIEKHIAILGGSTTHDIRDMLELFLLEQGIKPVFFESEYNQYWQDAMFGNPELKKLSPDVIFIHTSNRNIEEYPEVDTAPGEIDAMLSRTFSHFVKIWDKLRETYRCPIIQNNFEYPFYRLLGNQDAANIHGRVNFITRLNLKFYEYAQTHDDFFINDINYLSADYGLEKWSDPFYWHMYKYCCCLDAIPYLAFSVSNIIKSIFGKNKKAFALDLDNTLWGGVVGDDGAENLEIGQETPMGEVYSEFQTYLKSHKKLGILLNVVSKNEPENALAGLNRPDSVLKPGDFISIKANWRPKSENLADLADELNLLPESFVFIDDNPAEREIIRRQMPGVPAPEIEQAEHYIDVIDRSRFFEFTGISPDDLSRNEMYRENMRRAEARAEFESYDDYLLSLQMKAVIRPFDAMYMSRIAQLTNKSNQFNLTTRRYTKDEIEAAARDENTVTLYGRLEDRFGDNGVVSVVIAEQRENALDIVLWLMSCRVLKRGMEFAMMDELAKNAIERGCEKLIGHYYPTAKNAMVKDFYKLLGFAKMLEDEDGNTRWELDLSKGYEAKQKVIKIAD